MGLLAQTEFATLSVLMFLVLMIGFFLWRSQRYLARQDNGRLPAAHHSRSKAPEQPLPMNAPDDLTRWEVHMHETARELCGQLDSKMSVLEHLVGEADRAAARLESALETASRPAGQGPARDAAGRPAGYRSDKSDRPSSHPASQAEALKAGGAGDEAGACRAGRARDAEPQLALEDRYEEIYLLADYGFDANEIARRVGSPVGEVQLILGLRENR